MSPEPVDVAVIGAGLVGATLGVALASAGVRVALIDRVAPGAMTAAPFDGRTTAIALASKRALDALGVWRALADKGGAILDIRISDARPGEDASLLHLHFDHRQAADAGETPQPMGWIVENRHIRAALLDRLAGLPAAALYAPADVARVERGASAVEIALGDGRTLTAALVVSAEGRGARLREEAGIRNQGWDYPQTAIVVTAEHELPHRGVAQEKFLPAGPFAILPMTDDPQTGAHRSSIVWTERRDLAAGFLALDEAAFAQAFAERFGDHLGAVRPVGPRFSYPLSVVHAERYVDRRLALVGDAAHGIHPIAGQGWNLGLRDVAALAEAIVDAKRLGLDVGAADTLARYEGWRRIDNLSLIAATDALNRLFSNDEGPVRLARDLGLALVNRAPPLKKLFMRHAMGTLGELPRLVRGEAL